MSKQRKVSNHFCHFDLAGFTYYEGVEIFNKLKVGTRLELVEEPDNTYDAKAVAVYYKDNKIGFIPRQTNREISKMLNCGHRNIFEAYINRISPDEYPENQIGVVVKVKVNL